MKKIFIFLNGSDRMSSFRLECGGVSSGGDQNPLVFAADGGLNLLLKKKISFENLIWIGDRDSVNLASQDFLRRSQNDPGVKQILLNPKKDHSDFAVILDQIRMNYGDEPLFLEIFGGLGGRGDHEIANVEEAKYFISQLEKGGVCFFHGGILVSNLPMQISAAKSQWISLFSSHSVGVSGCTYSGRFDFKRPSHGLSNFVEQDVVEIKPEGLVMVCVAETEP